MVSGRQLKLLVCQKLHQILMLADAMKALLENSKGDHLSVQTYAHLLELQYSFQFTDVDGNLTELMLAHEESRAHKGLRSSPTPANVAAARAHLRATLRPYDPERDATPL